MQCHWGPRLTDDAFHDLRLPTGRRDGVADPGRLDGVALYRASEFRGDGRWSDDRSEQRHTSDHAALLGQFKTPSLRGVADLAFYGHGGTFSHLALVTESYGMGGLPASDPASAGIREPWLVPFGETAQWGLVPFLAILTAHPVVP
jgi:cytochrome c peroxidase